MSRTRGSDRFATELTAQMSPTTLNAAVLTTAGSPPSPCLLVIDHDVPAKAEIVLFDGTFDGTTFRTTSLANRYRQGSAAGSGITHDAAANVIFAALGSHHEEIHDELDTHEASSSVHGAVSAASANTIVKRDGSARFQAASPNVSADVATKGYVDAKIPVGGIILWSGSVGAIPTGWQLCNGTNGTPDLRGRFIVGAGGAYAVNESGGNQTHTHSGPSHSHTSAGHSHSITGGGFHTHGGGSTGGAGAQVDVGQVNEQSVASPNHTHPISNDGTHDHNGAAGSTTPAATGSAGTGNTGSTDQRPPYYAIVYIQRVS